MTARPALLVYAVSGPMSPVKSKPSSCRSLNGICIGGMPVALEEVFHSVGITGVVLTGMGLVESPDVE
jgi:hypothetical protein